MKNIIIAILLAALCVLGYWYYNAKDTLHDVFSTKNLDSLSFKKIINSKGIEVAQAQAIIVYQQEQIQHYGDTVFNLSKNQSKKDRDYIALLRANQKLELQLSAGYLVDDTIPMSTDTTKLCDDCIHTPKRFAYQDGNMDMYGTVHKDRVDIDSGAVYNTISFRLLEKKEGIFRVGVSVDAINSNKAIRFEGIQAVYVQSRQTAWSRVIKPIVCFVAGCIAVRFLTK